MAARALVKRKGLDKFAESELSRFLIDTGRANGILMSDNEPAVTALSRSVFKSFRSSLSARTGPAYSPQTMGTVERHHGLLGQIKTLQADILKPYDISQLDIRKPLFHWLVRHACFLLNRYLLHADNQPHLLRTKVGQSLRLCTVPTGRVCTGKTERCGNQH